MFNDFWAIYPKKVAKKDAEKAWNRLNAAQKITALEALPAHTRRWTDPQFMPHAATWLNGERFDDVLPPMPVRAITSANYQTPNEKAKSLADRLTGRANAKSFDFIDIN